MEVHGSYDSKGKVERTRESDVRMDICAPSDHVQII
jgi:hypothetical protein